MVTRSFTLSSAALLCLASCVSGFSPLAPRTALVSRTRSATTTSARFAFAIESEEEATTLMQKARECAFSDSCPIDEAEGMLQNVLRIQEGCVAGTLAGQDLCGNADTASEIVANLREKINSKPRGYGVLAADGAAFSPDLVQPAFVALTAVMIAMTVAHVPSPISSEDAFTAQEWMWAAQGGYLGEMVHHYLQNGGI